MKIGILQINQNSFPPFFYNWIENLCKKNDRDFVFIGSKKWNFKNTSFVNLPFNLSHWFAKAKDFESFFLQHNLDICFVPETFKTNIEGCLLVFVTSQGFIFKNEEKLKKIKEKKHIVITPFSFLNTQKNWDNVFTIYPPLPVLKNESSDKNNTFLSSLKNPNYLLCYSKYPNFDDVIFLLKAFSILKKKQKTQLQMVLLWKKIYPSIAHKLLEYKYKDDVLLIEDENAAAIFQKMVVDAYLFVSPFWEEKKVTEEYLFSLSTHTPIVAIKNSFSEEIIGNAGMVVSRKNIGEMADALKKIYLEEKFKKQLSKEAEKQFLQLSFDFNIEKLNSLLYEQEALYKKNYFHIKQIKNENRKTITTH